MFYVTHDVQNVTDIGLFLEQEPEETIAAFLYSALTAVKINRAEDLILVPQPASISDLLSLCTKAHKIVVPLSYLRQLSSSHDTSSFVVPVENESDLVSAFALGAQHFLLGPSFLNDTERLLKLASLYESATFYSFANDATCFSGFVLPEGAYLYPNINWIIKKVSDNYSSLVRSYQNGVSLDTFDEILYNINIEKKTRDIPLDAFSKVRAHCGGRCADCVKCYRILDFQKRLLERHKENEKGIN